MSKNKNIIWHPHKVDKEARLAIKKHKTAILWFTGLSGSGKSTIAHELDSILNKNGIHSYILDGDNIRHGLNKDLGFSSEDRRENIRRIGEVAKLFVEAGLITIVAFISPFASDRDIVRSLVDSGEFIEIYAKCSLDVCKERDPKGFYKKAMSGEIKDFTGISHPYEEPQHPEIVLETDKLTLNECTGKVMDYLQQKQILGDNKKGRSIC